MLSKKGRIKIIKTKLFKLYFKKLTHKKEMEDTALLRGLQMEFLFPIF